MNSPCFTIDGAYSGSYVYIQELTVQGCISDPQLLIYGGAFRLQNAGTLYMQSVDVIDNVAYSGAAVYVDFYYSYLSMIDGLVSNNLAHENTGGVTVSATGHFTSNGTRFQKNKSNAYGGAIVLYYGTFDLDDIVIEENSAVYEGGGLVAVNSIGSLTNSIITSNEASISGGIGCYSASLMTIDNCEISHNRAQVVAGAIGVSTEGDLTLTSINITGNQAPAGGGIASNSAILTILNTSFNKNSAFSPLTFSLISSAQNSLCKVAGGCFYSSGFPELYSNNEDCVFQPNADGILQVKSFFTEGGNDILTVNGVSYSGFEGPSCVNVSKGQNITWHSNNLYAFPGFEICLSEITSGGGALYVSGGEVSVKKSIFRENTATRLGGTVELIGGNIVMYETEIVSSDFNLVAPINIDAGYFTSHDFQLMGNVEGSSAVISYCNSKCGKGRIGKCNSTGEFAPSCFVNCECSDCPTGTYSDAVGTSLDTCIECPVSYSSNAGSSSCDIAAEGYYIENGGNLTFDCPQDAICDGGLYWPRPLQSYWVDRTDLEKAIQMNKCFRKTCVGTSASDKMCWLPECYGGDNSCAGCDDNKLQCSEGARGPLCGSCEEGYSYSSSTQNCLKCNLQSWKVDHSIIFLFSLLLMVSVCGLLYFRFDQLPESVKLLKVFQYARDAIAAIVRHSDSGALRVLWVNYQIIDSVSWTLEVDFPSPMSQFLDSLHFVSLDFYIIDCIPGGYLTSVLLWSLVPIGLAIMNQSLCWLRVKHASYDFHAKQFIHPSDTNLRRISKSIQNEHFSYFLLLVFTLLPPVLRRQFVALYCFDLQGEKYLRIDSSIDCNSESYGLFLVFDCLGIVIYMAVPLLWALLLYRQRFILNPPGTDEELVYYIRDKDEELQPLRFLFVPYRPGSMYFESIEMFRRVMFIGVLPLLFAHSDRAALVGMFMALCSLELFRNLEPFKARSTNLLAYVAQYVVLLTFTAALMLEVGIEEGLSDLTIGVTMLLLNISVLTVAVSSATLRYFEEKKKRKVVKQSTTNKVEYAVDFSIVKFNTTFEAIVQNSVPPSSCLVFWYTDMKSAQHALKSGIPTVALVGDLKSLSALLGQRTTGISQRLTNNQVGGIAVTLNSPAEIDETDKKYFPNREVVLACSVPRRWLTSVNTVDTGGSGIRVISSFSLQALRGNYFSQVPNSKPWYEGGIFLPPKAIRRAYQLSEIDEGITVASPQIMKDLPYENFIDEPSQRDSEKSLSTSAIKPFGSSGGVSRSRLSSSRLLNRKIVSFITPPSCFDFTESMLRIRSACTVNGWAPLYHYTQPMFGHMIAKTGFRMSTQGQGDGGVYFSTKGPCSYGLGTAEYETKIIADCYGEGRLDELRGKHRLDLVVVYGVLPHVLSPAPGGRDNAVMVKKADFEAMTYPHADGNYFLRPDRILGMFIIKASQPLTGASQAKFRIQAEKKKDGEVKNWISAVQRRIEINEDIANSSFLSYGSNESSESKEGDDSDDASTTSSPLTHPQPSSLPVGDSLYDLGYREPQNSRTHVSSSFGYDFDGRERSSTAGSQHIEMSDFGLQAHHEYTEVYYDGNQHITDQIDESIGGSGSGGERVGNKHVHNDPQSDERRVSKTVNFEDTYSGGNRLSGIIRRIDDDRTDPSSSSVIQLSPNHHATLKQEYLESIEYGENPLNFSESNPLKNLEKHVL